MTSSLPAGASSPSLQEPCHPAQGIRKLLLSSLSKITKVWTFLPTNSSQSSPCQPHFNEISITQVLVVFLSTISLTKLAFPHGSFSSLFSPQCLRTLPFTLIYQTFILYRMWCSSCAVCTDTCVGAHASLFMWRPEVSVRCLPSVTLHPQFLRQDFPVNLKSTYLMKLAGNDLQ